MANESINLNLIPKGEMPVIHVSQFDNGRQFNINLLKGSDEYTLPAGYTAVLNCRKADRNIVTLATTSVLSNTLTFTTTTQLCACAGKNICEVVIKDAEDFNVGTLNFILEVEKDPLQGGIESTSEIHDLETQIEDITTEIISENYYTKTETDTLLDAKADASDLATVATSGSYNDLNNLPKLNGMTISGNRTAQWYGLASKLNDLSDVNLSPELSEFDTLIYNSFLNKWINSKMNYNWLTDQPDISGMIEQAIYDILPESTLSGSVASFNTDLETPLTALTVDNSATKLVHISGDASLGNYFRGLYLGNYNFVDLGSLTWLKIGMGSGRYGFRSTINEMALTPASNVKINAICSKYITYTGNEVYLGNIGIGGWGANTHDIAIYDPDYESGDESEFKTAVNGVYLIYELAEAVTPSITDSQFEDLCEAFNIEDDIYILPVSSNPDTYEGDNTFFTDYGDISLSYKESIQHYIDRKVGT